MGTAWPGTCMLHGEDGVGGEGRGGGMEASVSNGFMCNRQAGFPRHKGRPVVHDANLEGVQHWLASTHSVHAAEVVCAAKQGVERVLQGPGPCEVLLEQELGERLQADGGGQSTVV